MTVKLSAAVRRKLLSEINRRLCRKYGMLRCKLLHRNPFELLVATILSAQCTDERVNQVTPGLFQQFPDAMAFAAAIQADVENAIKPAGLFRNKAKNIIAASRCLVAKYHGETPSCMADLTSLPGIGRKTANVVLGDAFGVPGFPVDTHVRRTLNRLGFTASTSPEMIETEATAAIAPERWTNLSHLLIAHGRDTCRARNPACGECPLQDICRYRNNQKKSAAA